MNSPALHTRLCVLFFVIVCNAASADIKVEFRTNADCSQCWSNITTHSGVTISTSNDVTINSPNTGWYRVSSSAPAAESIGLVKFTGSAAPFTLLIAPPGSNLT